VGWTHSDAIFQNFFVNCPMIISAIPKNISSFKRISNYPSKLIVDSGALYYLKHQDLFHLKEIFYRQIELIKHLPQTVPIKLAHIDRPMFNAKNLSEKYEVMEKTLLNAYEYLELFSGFPFKENIQPLGVIQGFDKPSIKYSIFELSKMGYKFFGIGSLLRKDPETQIEYIREVASLVNPESLHVFGVTGIPQIKRMVEMGVSSFDSTRPTKASIYFSVLYSDPFRVFYLQNSRVEKRGNRISDPLPCNCPICKKNPNDILIPAPRKFMKLRSIHNYYNLAKTIIDIQKEIGGEDYVVSDMLRTRNHINL
jgi:7-cyano-7-deazaguanine tRNA-ribosyltransferase